MENDLFIEETKNTPSIVLSSKKGIISIEGKSFPENANDFYNRLGDWLVKYRLEKDFITIETHFYYVSSSSIIAFLKLLKKSETIFAPDKITLIWKYDDDDEDILRIGEDYKKLVNCNIIFEEKKEE